MDQAVAHCAGPNGRPVCGAVSESVVVKMAFDRLYPQLRCRECIEMIHA